MSHYHDDPVDHAKPARKFLPGFMTLIILLASGGFFVKTTFAANVVLGSGGAIEFGQSVLQTTACSDGQSLTVTPKSTFVNAANGTGAHRLGSITVSNIPNSCNGVDFTLSAFDASSSTPLPMFNSTSTEAVVHNDGGTFRLGRGNVGMTLTRGAGTFTVEFTTPVTEAGSVSKVTIQSGVHRNYIYGDTGPGGGIVFAIPTRFGGTWSLFWTYEMALTDLSSSAKLCDGTPPASPLSLRDGYANMDSLLLNCTGGTGGAAKLASDFTFNGFYDWYLPSKHEAIGMCRYARSATAEAPLTDACSGGTLRSGFSDMYVTSTSTSATTAWHVKFTGEGAVEQAITAGAARAIRRFDPTTP